MTDGTPSATPPAAAAPPAETACAHCGLPLTLDDIWGWIHANGRYLCYDPNTGEPLSMPAEPAYS